MSRELSVPRPHRACSTCGATFQPDHEREAECRACRRSVGIPDEQVEAWRAQRAGTELGWDWGCRGVPEAEVDRRLAGVGRGEEGALWPGYFRRAARRSYIRARIYRVRMGPGGDLSTPSWLEASPAEGAPEAPPLTLLERARDTGTR